jgi:hypothetical protein
MPMEERSINMQFRRKELIQVWPILEVNFREKKTLLDLLDTNDAGKRSVQNHVSSDEGNEEIEVHDEPAGNCEKCGEFISEENVHVVKQVGNRFSFFVDVDEKSKIFRKGG